MSDLDLARWNRAGRRLQQLNPERLNVVLQLGLTYLAAFEQPGEPEAVFVARLAALDEVTHA